jgi:hypothetical protein
MDGLFLCAPLWDGRQGFVAGGSLKYGRFARRQALTRTISGGGSDANLYRRIVTGKSNTCSNQQNAKTWLLGMS